LYPSLGPGSRLKAISTWATAPIFWRILLFMFRTDENNNPSALTTDVAKQAGLTLGVDYVLGTPFPAPSNLVTAKLLGDPVAVTIRVITAIGYRTRMGSPRWTYICLPKFVWALLSDDEKRDVIGYQYQNEGGTEMRHLFPNYGQQ
jgi:hypothetical protein